MKPTRATKRIREQREGVTSEDAFGTPPAARGSMMSVAGASDDDLDWDDELLTDGDPNVMKGPVYPESRVLVRLGDLRILVNDVVKKLHT